MAHLEVPGADPGVDVGSEEVLLPGELLGGPLGLGWRVDLNE